MPTKNFKITNLSSTIALLTFLSTSAHGLTLYDALQTSISGQPEVLAKGFEADAAHKMSIGSLWQMGPTFSLSTNRDSFGTRTLTTRIQQPLFTGGRIINGIKESRAKRDIAEAELALTEQQAISKIASAYLDLGKLQFKKRNSEANTNEHKRLFNLIDRRYKAGISSLNDVTTARVRLKQAESELSQINSQLSVASNFLSELLGRPLNSSTQLDLNLRSNYTRTLSDTEFLALNASPAVLSQRFKMTASEAKSAIDRSNLLPQVFLRHEKYDRSSVNNASITEQTFVVLEYQLGGGPSSAYAWQASVSQQQSASSMLASTERDVRNNVAKFWNQYQSGLNQVNLIKEQEQAANEVVESFLRQYAIGKKTWLDVLNSQRESYQTRNSLVDTQAAVYQSHIELLILTGDLKPDSLESIK